MRKTVLALGLILAMLAAPGFSTEIASYKFTASLDSETSTLNLWALTPNYVDSYPTYNTSGDGATKGYDVAATTAHCPENTSVGTTLDIGNSTFRIWFKADVNSVGTDEYMYRIFEDGNNFHTIYREADNENLYMYMRDGGVDFKTPLIDLTNDQDWHHYVIVINKTAGGTVCYGYVDGVLVGTDDPCVGLTDFSPAEFTVGSYAGTSLYISGVFDEIRLDDVPWTNENVSYDYNYGIPKPAGGAPPSPSFNVTVAEYKFSDNLQNEKQGLNLNSSTTGFLATYPSYNEEGNGGPKGYDVDATADNVPTNRSFGNELDLENMSVRIWFKADIDTSVADEYLFNIYKDGNSFFLLKRESTDDNMYLYVRDDAVDNAYTIIGNMTGDKSWHHYVITVNKSATATTCRAYVDTVLQATDTTCKTLSDIDPDNLVFGSYSGSGNFISGVFDEFRLDSVAWGVDNITDDYNYGYTNYTVPSGSIDNLIPITRFETNSTLSEGLLSYWNFSGGSMDDYFGVNNWTPQNNDTYSADCAAGDCLYCPPDLPCGYFNTTGLGYNLYTESTLGIWFKPQGTKCVTGNNKFLWGINSLVGNDYMYAERDATDDCDAFNQKYKNSTVIVSDIFSTLDSGWGLYVSTWYANNTCRTFINGTLALEDTSCMGWDDLDATPQFILGGYQPVSLRGAQGYIDEMFISNRAMTEDEISDLWNSGSGTFTWYKTPVASNFTYAINFTSDGGQLCGWNGTEHKVCGPTNDTTPTFTWYTNGSANCSISTVALNRSSCGANCWTCSTTGGTTHSGCTVGSNLTYGATTTLYVTCSSGGAEMTLFNHSNVFNITLGTDPNTKVYAYIRDEQTQALINDITTTLEFISDNQVYNFTTSNGIFVINSTVAQDYILRYSADGYGRKRHYYVTVVNQTANNFTLYLLNNTISSDIQVVVYNKVDLKKVDEAIVYVQRYYQTENAYKTVAMYQTDSGGNAYFDLEKTTERYKFWVDYPWGTNYLMTTGDYVEEDIVNLYIDFSEPLGQILFDKQKISSKITYSGTSNSFTVSYQDPTSIGSSYCLYIKGYGYYGNTIYNLSCISAQSGSIELKHPDVNRTYYAVFTSTFDGQETIIMTAFKDVESKPPLGTYGVFMSALVIILLAFVGSFHILALILASSGLVFAKLMGLLAIDWGWVLGIYALSLILGILMRSFYGR